MTKPSESGEISAFWNRQQATWGLFAVGAVALAPVLADLPSYLDSLSSYLDSSPRRWRWLEKIDLKPCYKNLTSENPSRGDCFHSEDEEKQEIPQRYFDWKHPHVAVYSTPASPHSAPSLRDLGEMGQAEAVHLLEKDISKKGGAWPTLRDALDQPGTKTGESDPFRFDRILIANVAKGTDAMPGDRIVWTRILVQPINFTFAGYTVAATDNQIKKVTSLETTDSRKFSADISATIPGMEGPKASIGPSSEHTVKTSSDITAQYEKFGIDIVPSFMRIMRESETGGDAVGNIGVSLTAVTDPDMIGKRYPQQAARRPSNEEPIVLLVRGTHFKDDASNQKKDDEGDKTLPAIDVLPQVPVRHCALRARVWMLYEERRVNRGRERYDESKQSVTLVRDAEDKQDVEIMSADEVSPAVWSINVCRKADDCKDLEAQPSVEPQNAASRKLVFTDYGVAVKLALWLRTHPTSAEQEKVTGFKFNYPSSAEQQTVAGFKLNYEFHDNGPNYAALVPVKINKDQCEPDPLLKRLARWLSGGRLFAEVGR